MTRLVPITEGPRPDLAPHMLDGPAPCDGCPRARRCALEHLACSAFEAYTRSRPWNLAPRVDASAERYQRLMNTPPGARRW